MDKLKILDLFSGIGGFSLGLEATGGFETAAFCEIEEYPRKVLNKHWPDVPIYEDVRNVTAERLRSDGIGRIDVVTGGFPCQDLSVAGKQAGINGERSGLWGELCRIIGDIRPSYAIVENVTALISGDNGRWFGKVLGDLAEIGYDCEWHCISASELGAHHHRDRVWIICYPQHVGQSAAEIREGDQTGNGGNEKRAGPTSKFTGPGDAEVLGDSACMFSNGGESDSNPSKPYSRQLGNAGSENNMANTIRQRQQGQGKYVKPLLAEAIKKWKAINAESGCISGIWSTESELGRVANGVSDRTHRLKGLGNSVVPQIPELIGMAILDAESCPTR